MGETYLVRDRFSTPSEHGFRGDLFDQFDVVGFQLFDAFALLLNVQFVFVAFLLVIDLIVFDTILQRLDFAQVFLIALLLLVKGTFVALAEGRSILSTLSMSRRRSLRDLHRSNVTFRLWR